MTIETRLLDFTTSDNETLHGLLFSPREGKSDLLCCSCMASR